MTNLTKIAIRLPQNITTDAMRTAVADRLATEHCAELGQSFSESTSELGWLDTADAARKLGVVLVPGASVFK